MIECELHSALSLFVYLVSLQLLISHYCSSSNSAITEASGTHTELGDSQLCVLLV